MFFEALDKFAGGTGGTYTAAVANVRLDAVANVRLDAVANARLDMVGPSTPHGNISVATQAALDVCYGGGATPDVLKVIADHESHMPTAGAAVRTPPDVLRRVVTFASYKSYLLTGSKETLINLPPGVSSQSSVPIKNFSKKSKWKNSSLLWR